MNAAEASPSSSQEAPAPRHQSHQQGSALGSGSVQAEAQVHSPESVNDADVLFIGAASAQEAPQVDHDGVDGQIPRRTRRPRGRQQLQEGRHGEGSRAYHFEGRIHDGDRSRSPPLDRRSSRSARSFRSRDQRRPSHEDGYEDIFPQWLIQRCLYERMVDIVPFFDGKKLLGVPKGFTIKFNQKSTVLIPMGTNWK